MAAQMIGAGEGRRRCSAQGGSAVEHMGVDPACPQFRLLARRAAGAGHGPTLGHQAAGQSLSAEAQSETEQVGHVCAAPVDKGAECLL